MRLPTRLTPQHPLRKLLAAAVVAATAMGLAIALHLLPGARIAMAALDNTLYDAFYRLRASEDRTHGPIVIVSADEGSMEKLAAPPLNYGWPWPRILWAQTIKYLQDCGAKAVVFDVIFKEPRGFDAQLGQAIDAAKIPVILATDSRDNGLPDAFSPKVKKPPAFGATNILQSKTVREYPPDVHGLATLALRTAQALNAPLPAWAVAPWRLHFFGPYQRRDGSTTYRYVPAYSVFKAAMMPAKAAQVGISPEMFRGKIVLIGGTAAGVYDLKSSPLSALYPGVEVHATAIEDLLNAQRVQPVGMAATAASAFVISLLAALGVILPRRAAVKVLLAAIAAVLLIGTGVELFVAQHIRWLPMASPIIALLVATVGAFAWSYLTEDRQRRLVLKALSQYVSPKVASEIERNPASLKLGGQRRDMTVMFTDIQGFTDLSESMESEKLSEMLNFYLGEMSALILSHNGTLDKYIGDAIMSFWNAPVVQPDHALLACRAALAMRDREAQIQSELAALGAKGMLTRIGINTGPMIFGNMGAPQKFNYSVLGDSVNLGSRLEGANKFYGSRILIAESTARLVEGHFAMRRLDMLRVKGKLKPLAVYELLCASPAHEDTNFRIRQYEESLKLYQSQSWDAAQAALSDLHTRFPDDLPAAALLARIVRLRGDPPPPDWDGVYIAKDK
ncbi:MAG TPA: adenylate/guanylate cyclase domain-containing protein [Tepidisphaeraceae bacterium]|nr:adenylate/guanylate cyclase domain-containing protein [Tepidisphaeraceae bacterium]